MADSTPAKPRDRGRTKAAILSAARDQLAEGGFQAFGVNTVARRAGCDKQLIYRYFGGLDGLVEAIGLELATWVDDSVAFNSRKPPADYRALSETLIMAFLDAFRSNVLVQKITAWEVAEPSPLAAKLAAARARALAGWIARTRGDLAPPAGVDAPAVNALLIAAVQHIVLSATNTGGFAGMPLASEADWDRIRSVLLAIIDFHYGPPAGG